MSCSGDTSDFLESWLLLRNRCCCCRCCYNDTGKRACGTGGGGLSMGCILNNREHRVVCAEEQQQQQQHSGRCKSGADCNKNGLHSDRGGILMMDSSDYDKRQAKTRNRFSVLRSTRNCKSQRTSFLSLLFRGRRAIQSVKINAYDESGDTDCCENDNNKFQSDRKHFKRESHLPEISSSHLQPIETNSKVEVHNNNKLDLLELPTIRKRKSSSSPTRADRIMMSNSMLPENSQIISGSNSTFSGESSSNYQPHTSSDQIATNDVNLFTSIHQLCYEIVNKTLLRKLPQNSDTGRVLCLFLFGCRGSSKGEIAFKLVDHSAMAKVLASAPEQQQSHHHQQQHNHHHHQHHHHHHQHHLLESDCPLYHHMDVAAVVAANIDARIREFHQLVAQTTRYRREQLSQSSPSGGDGGATCDTNQEGRASPMSEQSLDSRLDISSLSSIELSSALQSSSLANEGELAAIDGETKATNEFKMSRQAADDFDLITPSTQQRSILQLKLMKYSNSVTPKWVFGLIEHQVDNIERQLKERFRSNLQKHSVDRLPDRVYLINLVPNQLSLFKSCLYLKQEVILKDFKYHYEAIKFERCTNIKLLTKERAVASENESSRESFSVSRTLGISHLRLPTLLGSSSTTDSSKSALKSSSTTTNQTHHQDQSNQLASIATTALADGVNEKLGPRLNEAFSQQFKSLNKLIQVRYNQMHDYNYATHLEGYESCWRNEESESGEQRVSCSRYLRRMSISEPTPLPTQTRCWSSCDQHHHQRQRVDTSDCSDNQQTSLRPEDRQLSSSMQELQVRRQPIADGPPRLSLYNFELVDHDATGTGNTTYSSTLHHLSSPSSQTSFLSSNSSVVTSVESDTTIASKPMHRQQQQVVQMAPHIVTRTNQHVLSAVELELFDSSSQDSANETGSSFATYRFDSAKHRWRGSSQVLSGSSNDSDQQHQQLAKTHSLRLPNRSEMSNNNSHHNNNSSESSSLKHKSPLIIFVNHQQKGSATSHYHLMPKKIVYTNEQTQVSLEVRRVQVRTLKLKTVSDLTKLHKMITKSAGQLETDCDSWLLTEIGKQKGAIEDHRRCFSPYHPQQTALSIGTHLSNERAPLIVCTIRVDIRRLKSGHFQYPSGFNIEASPLTESSAESQATKVMSKQVTSSEKKRKLVPILKLNNNNKNNEYLNRRESLINWSDECRPRRALSAQGSLRNSQRSTSSADNGTRLTCTSSNSSNTNQRSQRRVHFRLSQAPGSSNRFQAADELSQLRAQRRYWINSGLFVSAVEQSGGSRVMDQVIALIRMSSSSSSSAAAASTNS